ncbi:DUF3857 domain-containing protein [Salinisphaera sp. SWV1]|uniref:DUF3857 domain-containing protein n=1 Tax=Salinisphaera sp. SWV1 TaxID=3454139 RepID=UPI003F834F63
MPMIADDGKPLQALAACIFVLVLTLGGGVARAAESQSGAAIRQLSFTADVHVKANGQFTERDSQVIEALTRSGAHSINPYQQKFSSALSKLKVVSAWIETAQGKHVSVPKSDIFVRPVQAAQGAPMFSHAKVLNVVLPNFGKGDKLHIETLQTQTKPYFPKQYFGEWGVDERRSARNQKVVVHAPAAMHLKAAQRGGWRMSHHTQGGTETFKATLATHHAHFPAPATVSAHDYSPLFEVTSFPSWASVGQAYWARAKPKARVTPRVRKVADKVAGKLHGWAAVKALYAWDSAHIRYVGLELGVGGYVPVSANKTLKTGYGDCKAHSTLLEALLAARGITAYPVMINWNNTFNLTPLPGPDFNHAIDYLPKYHVFLDATGETETPGQLAIGERDKTVVVAGPHPRVMHTPGGQPDHNKLVYNAQLQLAPDGTLSGKAHMTTSGWWAWYNRMMFSEIPPGAYGRLMNALLKNGGGGKGSFQHSNPRVLDKPFHVSAHWTTPAYAIPGKTLTVSLQAGPYLVPDTGGTNDPVSALAAVAGPNKRTHSVSTYLGEIDWHTTLTLPAGYTATYLPPAAHIHNAAGNFSFSVHAKGNKVQANYKLRLAHVLYKPAQYAKLRSLLRSDLRDLNTPLVFSHSKSSS